MKSRIILIMIGLIILLGIAIYGPKLYANNSENYNDYPYMYDNEETNNYEFVYIHLGDEDQALLDLAFINAYKEKTLIEDMTVEKLDEIKLDLAKNYDVYNGYPRFQMMGRNYGGVCHGNYNDDEYESYEWTYIHQSIETQEIMDQLMIEKLSEISFDDLTNKEILDEYQNIKKEILLKI